MNASTERNGPRQHLTRAVDTILAAIVGIVPLLMGGRHPLGKLVYVALVAALSVVWAGGQCLSRRAYWRRSGAEFLLVAAVLLVVLQLAYLPQSWVDRLSPQIGKTLVLWSSPAGDAVSFGPWTCLSLTPVATRQALALLLAHGLLLVVVLQRLNKLEDVERLLRWIALAVVGMAVLGLAQYLFGNGKFLWIYQHPSRTTFAAVKGMFANENHFAHYLVLGLGPLVWWLVRALDSDRWARRSANAASPTQAASRCWQSRWRSAWAWPCWPVCCRFHEADCW